ncbi:MAG: hypothetical protein NZM44_06520, partial [Candidatus Calescibacterium sp.]|nr:hypothetical protein [Candidatus Calescibacterium sp.]
NKTPTKHYLLNQIILPPAFITMVNWLIFIQFIYITKNLKKYRQKIIPLLPPQSLKPIFNMEIKINNTITNITIATNYFISSWIICKTIIDTLLINQETIVYIRKSNSKYRRNYIKNSKNIEVIIGSQKPYS